jgi:hypothetical protein
MNGNKARSVSIDVHRWRLCRSRKEAVNIVIPAKAGIQCYQVLWGFRVKPGMAGGSIIQRSRRTDKMAATISITSIFRAERGNHLREKTYDE